MSTDGGQKKGHYEGASMKQESKMLYIFSKKMFSNVIFVYLFMHRVWDLYGVMEMAVGLYFTHI